MRIELIIAAVGLTGGLAYAQFGNPALDAAVSPIFNSSDDAPKPRFDSRRRVVAPADPNPRPARKSVLVRSTVVKPHQVADVLREHDLTEEHDPKPATYLKLKVSLDTAHQTYDETVFVPVGEWESWTNYGPAPPPPGVPQQYLDPDGEIKRHLKKHDDKHWYRLYKLHNGWLLVERDGVPSA